MRHVVPWDQASVPWPGHPNWMPRCPQMCKGHRACVPSCLCGCVQRALPFLSVAPAMQGLWPLMPRRPEVAATPGA